MFLLLASLFSAPGFSQSSTYDIRQHFDRLYRDYEQDTPGVAVIVVEGDSLRFAEGYGSANLEYGIPIDTGTVFQVGSVSKQFTAFAVYLLIAEGRIDLEEAAARYLPEISYFDPAIRIKHLLYHTSGLKDNLALLTFAGYRVDDHIGNEDILRLVARQRELNFPPGSAFQYSNTNYVLLAELVKRVAGTSLDRFLRERVFDPLGMDHTQFYDDHERLVPNRAYGYDFEEGRFEKEVLNNSYVGSTGLFTTAADLAKWAANFYEPIVGDSTLIAAFNAPATLDSGEPAWLDESLDIRHAKGQFIRRYRGATNYIHTGSDGGYRAFLGRWPEQRLTVILLSNDIRFAPYPNGFGFAESYLASQLEPNRVITPSPTDTAAVDLVPEPTPLPPPEQAAGTYRSDELNSTFQLHFVDQEPILSHFRLGDLPLEDNEAGRYRGVNYYSFELEFVADETGGLTGFDVIDFRGERLRFDRVQDSSFSGR
ncbi:serine hydrolase domain-containing protein [Lewinella sp. IMCC34191]|uniref:serine hydrolase domain-containing protein n=1 Tax=Lewinella sp. IMCC34191 TaxID=2259172 RepID=UPI0013005434|nr:serine hydrolase domain-containing protein [Lewinella sp. IMCC34191]